MGSVAIEVTASEVAQAATLDGRVVVDPGPASLAGVHLRMIVPPEGFDSVTIAPTAFGGPQDAFAVEGPVGPAGIVDVVGATDTPLAGSQELFTFTCDAVGLRGFTYTLRTRAIEALDQFGVPVELDPSAIDLLVSPAQAEILPAELTQAERGMPYAGVLAAQGGEQPYAWAQAGGSLPPGLALRDGGVIEGTPTQGGVFTFTVSLTDASASPAQEASFSITVLPQRPQITTASLPLAVSGRPYGATLQVSGGSGAVVWGAEGLPPGLHLQQGRIEGTVSAERQVCGVNPVTLTVREGAAPARSDQHTLDLTVLPASVSSVAVQSPGALAVGRDLYVTTFDVDISVSSYVPEMDEETRTTLEDALEALMADIVTVLGIPGIDEKGRPGLPVDYPRTQPRQPDVVDPVPGEEPPPGRERGPRDVLAGLIDEYRRLDDWLTNTTNASAFVEVYIDGELVKSHRPELFKRGRRYERRQMHPTVLAVHRKSLARTPERKRVDKLLGKGARRDELLKEASRYFRDVLAGKGAHPGLDRTDTSDAGGIRPGAGGLRPLFFGGAGPPGERSDPFDPIRDAIDGLAEWASRWLDDFLIPPRLEGESLELTPGAHRVRVTVEKIATSFDRDPFDAAAAAGSVVAATVRIQPQNTEGWPRLAEGLVWNSGGVRSVRDQTFVADLAGSELDVMCATDDVVRILPATGDAAGPYASPRSFSCHLGLTPTRLTAGRQDEIGRSALVAVDGARARVAVNRGVGGFLRCDVPRAFGAEPVGAVRFGPADENGWSKLILMSPRSIDVVEDLVRSLDEPAGEVTVTTTGVRSLVTHDRCTSLAYYRDPIGTDFVAVAFFMAGTVQVYPLQGNGTLGNPTRLAGFDTIDHRRQVVTLDVASVLPGRSFLVLGLRQGHALAPFEITANGLAPLPTTTLPMGLMHSAAGPGDGGGIALVFEPRGAPAWAWWDDSQTASRPLPVPVAGEVHSVAAAENVLAVAERSPGRVRMFERAP